MGVVGALNRLAGIRVLVCVEELVQPVRLAGRIAVIVELGDQIITGRSIRDLLRETRHHRVARAPRDLTPLVQEDARVLRAQDLLRALLVVQSPKPHLAVARKLDEQLSLVEVVGHAWETKAHDFWQRVMRDRLAYVRQTEACDEVTRSGGLKGSLDDLPDDEQRLPGARSTFEQYVASRAVQDLLGLLLFGGEGEVSHCGGQQTRAAIHSPPGAR